jgi:hypothetical protein
MFRLHESCRVSNPQCTAALLTPLIISTIPSCSTFEAGCARLLLSVVQKCSIVLLLQIGKVVGIVKPDEAYCSRPEDRDVQLQVNWFYRPEEAVGGRKVRGQQQARGSSRSSSTPRLHRSSSSSCSRRACARVVRGRELWRGY